MELNIKKLTMQKKWDEAVIEYERCLRFHPHNAATLFGLSEALENINLPQAAISVLEEIIDVDKTAIEAYRKLGKLWGGQDQPEKAISYWEKLRQLKPDDKEAGKAIRDLSAATMVKKAEERKQQAGDESFKALLKSEEESADLEKKAKIIRTDEDRVEAIRLKKEDLKKDPTNSRLWRELGTLYQDLKNWKFAGAAYRKALEVNPHDLFAKEKIGVLAETQYVEEIEQLRQKVEAGSTNGDAEAAAAREELKKKEAVFKEFRVQEYDRRVRAHPTDYELKLQYGRVLMEAEKYDDAIGQFQKSVKDPKFKVPSHLLIGKCFEHKTLYDLAESEFGKALEGVSDPDSEVAKEIRYSLGFVAEKKGDRPKALKWYQEIMSVDISYRDVSARVSNLMRNGGGS
jgi:tetratricopeptide (TPR) repeat protein